MEGKKKIIIIGSLAIVSFGLAFVFFSGKVNWKSIFNSKTDSTETSKSVVSNICNNIKWTNDNFPLKLGSEGPNVYKLQSHLALFYSVNMPIDGKLGCKTLDAIKKNMKTDIVTKERFDSEINGLL